MSPELTPVPAKKRMFLFTMFGSASKPPLIREIFQLSDIETDNLPDTRQFIITVPPVGGSGLSIKELY